MKGYLLHNINDFQYEEVDIPVAERDTVIVKIRAVGICGSDILRIYRNGAYSYPLIPGHEFSGEVVATGENVDTDWIRKRVAVFPLIPCMECSQCLNKKYETCKAYSYLGSRVHGGFAEFVKVPVWNLLDLPANVSFEQAAMMEPMAVAVHAIRQIAIKNTDSIAVCGLGSIGLLVLMFLLELGYEHVYALGNKDLQKKFAGLLGIPEENFCDIRFENMASWVAAKTKKEGINVFFDCVGKNDILKQGIQCVSSNGKLVLVGNPESDVSLEKEIYWKILRSQLTLSGSWNSSFTHSQEDDWHYVLQKLAEGRIEPERLISHRYSFEELSKGFELMRDKSEEYAKVMGKL